MSDVLNHVSNKDVRKYLQEIRKEGYTFSITGGTHVRIECGFCKRMVTTTGCSTSDFRAIRNLRATIRRHSRECRPAINQQPPSPAPTEEIELMAPPKLNEMDDAQLTALVAALSDELRTRNMRKLNEHLAALETKLADVIAEAGELKLSDTKLWEASDKINLFKKEAKL